MSELKREDRFVLIFMYLCMYMRVSWCSEKNRISEIDNYCVYRCLGKALEIIHVQCDIHSVDRLTDWF